MGQTSRTILRFTLMFLLACVPLFAQRRAGGAGTHAYNSSGAAAINGRGGGVRWLRFLPFVQFAS